MSQTSQAPMRNLFDQYSQPENRLTHAVAVSLNEDRRLLREFLRWIDVSPPISVDRLAVIEQSLPGDLVSDDEMEAARRGLPDFVIHDGEEWCILVESKIQAGLTHDQLIRHEKTLRRRGLREITSVVLTKDGANAPPDIKQRSWSGLYEWLGAMGDNRDWPRRLREYLRAAEARLAREGYLTEGTLTMFDGFSFSPSEPYTYGEAKRLIRLVREELCKSKGLQGIGMDPHAPGRTAITGRAGDNVWDFLQLTDRPKNQGFTRYPHLTLAVASDHLGIAITIPNGVVPEVRDRLAALGTTGIAEMCAEILERTKSLRKEGAVPEAYALQRHYLSQRSGGTRDGFMSFRLETSQERRLGRTKYQPEWMETFALLLTRKRSNIQFGFSTNYPWTTERLHTAAATDLIADTWIAMKPILDVVRGR